MSDTVREWVAKAQGDYRVARRELSAADEPSFDAVCFHSQQCAEKLIKALLIREGVVPPKTHDLSLLSNLLVPLRGEPPCSPEDLRFLTQAATLFRYPGESAERQDATQAVEICEALRRVLLAELELPAPAPPDEANDSS